MNDEMRKLREYLNAKGIKWQDVSDDGDYPITRTHFKVKRQRWSVIFGFGTYGSQHGLLELMIGNNDPAGWLTADDVIKRIEK